MRTVLHFGLSLYSPNSLRSKCYFVTCIRVAGSLGIGNTKTDVNRESERENLLLEPEPLKSTELYTVSGFIRKH